MKALRVWSIALSVVGGWGTRAGAQTSATVDPPATASPGWGASDWTMAEGMFIVVLMIVGIGVCYALAWVAFTSMIRSRREPAEAYWQSVAGLLFGAWFICFLALSRLFWQGISVVNWWFWGFYLLAGIVAMALLSRFGRAR